MTDRLYQQKDTNYFITQQKSCDGIQYNNINTRHSNLISIEMDWGKLGEAMLKNINASTGKNMT